MNIVYTINGEGMGHASRSSVVVSHLISRGHSVAVFGSGDRPLAYLKKKFKDVTEVTGLHMVYKENSVKRLRTVLKVMGRLPQISHDLIVMKRRLDTFRPDVVITDYDFHGSLIAQQYHVPLISIDNIQYITQAKLTVLRKDLVSYELNYLVSKMMVPRADHFFITVFDAPRIRNRTKAGVVEFVPPILREKITKVKPKIGKHILVYQTSDSSRDIFEILGKSKEQFIVYNNKKRRASKNIVCKDFDEDAFIRDLASARAVIANGGFTVLTESLYLHKPVLSVPIQHHYEQILNGLLLEKLGVGMMARSFTTSALNGFLKKLDMLRAATKKISFDNEILFSKLDTLLAKIKT